MTSVISNLNDFIMTKCEMFICEHISQLIAYTFCITDNQINVTVRMTINPIVDIAAFYIFR